jgi:hypothetical protein
METAHDQSPQMPGAFRSASDGPYIGIPNGCCL